MKRLTSRDDPQDWLDAWETLVAEYGGRVYGLTLRTLRHREDAEDATQEVWRRVLHGLDRYRGDASLTTWLFRIAMNVCLTRLESRTRHVEPDTPEDDPFDQLPDTSPGPDRQLWGREALAAAERALGRLDPTFRAVVILRDVEGLSYDEIAQVLDVPINTVKTRLHRARLGLQDALAAFR